MWSFHGWHIHSVWPSEEDYTCSLTPGLFYCEPGNSEQCERVLLRTPVLWEQHIEDTESGLFQISEEEEQENDGTEESWKSVFVSEGWKTAHLE